MVRNSPFFIHCVALIFELPSHILRKKPVLSIQSTKLYPWSPVSGGMHRSSISCGSTVLALHWRKPSLAKPVSASQGTDEQVSDQSTVYERVRVALEELGPTFVKFGQIMSTRTEIFPPELLTS